MARSFHEGSVPGHVINDVASHVNVQLKNEKRKRIRSRTSDSCALSLPRKSMLEAIPTEIELSATTMGRRCRNKKEKQRDRPAEAQSCDREQYDAMCARAAVYFLL